MKNNKWLRVFVFLLVFFAFLAAYFAIGRPWLLNWGSTPEERAARFPGDELVPDSSYKTTRTINIAAAPERVWAWQVQIGQDRGGFYSYHWLENLVFADIHNTEAIRPQWQDVRLGLPVMLTSQNYPLGLVKREKPDPFMAPPFAQIEPPVYFVLKGWGSFNFLPLADGGTRLLLRGPMPHLTRGGKIAMALLYDAPHFIMERQMMRNVKRLAEGRPSAPRWLTYLAWLGFIAISSVAVRIIIGRRRRWPWMVLPAAYSLLILISTGDVQATLVGLTAVLLIIAGIIRFRSEWWAYILGMWIYAHLVLLFAPDAFIIFGVVFLIVAATTALSRKTACNG